MIAERFKIDPIIVLEADYFRWAVRVAAANYVTSVEEAAQAKAQRSQGSKVQVPHWVG